MATLSITVPDAQIPRVQAAIGFKLGLFDANRQPRLATAEEVRQYLVQVIIDDTRIYEADQAEKAARDAVTEIGAT
jgi:hypothetical protein